MNNDRRRLRSRPLLLCGILLAFAGAAQGALIANSAAAYAEPHTASLTGVNGPTGPVSSTSTVSPNGVAGGGGHGEAAYGALRTSAEAVVSSDGQGRGIGSAALTDSVTPTSSFLGRAIGRGTFNLSGGLASRVGPTSTASLANSTLGVQVMVDGNSVFRLSAQLLSRNGVIEIDSVTWSGSDVAFSTSQIGGSYSFAMPFTLGTPFSLFASMNSEAQALGSSSVDDAAASSNFASTGYWGGITDIHLDDGTGVGDIAFGSASGFDWGHAYGFATPPVTAVPEPGTYALMLAGLALIGRAARRRPAAEAI